jgi:hypothetical protein
MFHVDSNHAWMATSDRPGRRSVWFWLRTVCQHTHSRPLNWKQLGMEPTSNPIVQADPLQTYAIIWFFVENSERN